MFSYAKNVASSPMDCTAEIWRAIVEDKDGKLLRILTARISIFTP